MAHLAHKLPWNALASHLELIHNRSDLTPRVTDLFCKKSSLKTPTLKYFLNALGRAINEFATTERKKYGLVVEPSSSEPLFPQRVLDDALPWLEKGEQTNLLSYGFNGMNVRETVKLESWIRHAGNVPNPARDHTYNEIVALLLAEDHMVPLLQLAKHPDVRLDLLDRAHGNYQYGWTTMISRALMSYVCFNLIYCKPELWTDGKKAQVGTRSFDRVVADLYPDFSGDMIFIPSRRFMALPQGRICYSDVPVEDRFDPFDDLDGLRHYLKTCFDMLVRYEMLEREAGRELDWSEFYAQSLLGTDRHKNGMFDFGHAFGYPSRLAPDGSCWR